MRYAQRKICGFTLIEALAFLFIFSVVSGVFYETFTVGMQHIHDARNRLGATALANQKMEIILSIPYEDVGTKRSDGAGGWLYGIPGGDILEDESVTVSGTTFQVHTFVQYVDDPYDGTAGTGTDGIPTDYKRVRLEVSWGDGSDARTVSVVANVADVGVESASNSGVLSINVLDSTGAGVPQATVHVVNNDAGIDLTTQTDMLGNLTLPGAASGVQNYRITATKEGYYGATTYPPYPTSTFDPTDEDASVVIGSVNQFSIVIDQNADITIRTKDLFGADVPNVDFSLTGGRYLGTDPSTNPATAVYGFSDINTTDASGRKEYENQHYGKYTFSPAPSKSGYKFVGVSPATDDPNSFSLLPGQDTEVAVIFADESISSMLVTVQNHDDLSPIANATVRLTESTSGFDQTVTTNAFGQAFFPSALPGLVAGTYNIEVTAAGFEDGNRESVVPGNALVEESFLLHSL